MKIDNISFLNIDDLYLYSCKTLNDTSFVGKSFGNNINNVLNNVCITFYISNISEYEYLIMKMISSDISEFYRYDDSTYYEIIKNNFSDIANDVKDVIDIFNNLPINYKRYYLPSGCIFGKCIVKIYGGQLSNLMNGNPFKFFSEISDGECVIVDNNRQFLNEEYVNKIVDSEITNNRLITLFLNYFYGAMRNKLLYIDLISDNISFNILNKYSKLNKAVLYSVRDFGYDVNFIDDDKTTIMETLKYNKANRIGDMRLTDIKLQFIIESSFGTYFDLFNILPNKCFVNIESLIIPNKTNKTENIPIIYELENFSARIKSKVTKLLNNIQCTYNTSEKLLQYSELTPNFAIYKYSILLSLNDINTYLNNFEVSDDFVNKETKSIISDIITYSKSIYSFLK